MEARKKVRPLVVCLIVFVCLLLSFCCFVSAGVSNFQPFQLRYGLRLVEENSLTAGVSRGEFVFLDRKAELHTGSVAYLPERDVYLGVSVVSGSQVKLTDGTVTKSAVPVHSKFVWLAPVMCFLQDYPAVSFGVAAAFILVLIVIKVTGPARWRKRQQNLIRENLASFGSQYAKEEKELEY